MAEKIDIPWALRQLRKPKITQLAASIETAERLRRPSPRANYSEEAMQEKTGTGRILAHSYQGGFRNALLSNRQAILRHFEEAAPILLESGMEGLLHQTAEHMSKFGIDKAKALKIIKDCKIKADEDELWAIYCKGGRQALEKATLPA